MTHRTLLFAALLFLLVACTTPPPPPRLNHTPELALNALYQQDEPLRIIANQPANEGVILFFTAENRGLAALNDPRPRMGSAYLEHDGKEWVTLLSTLGSPPDPATLSERIFTFGTNSVVDGNGNGTIFLQGQVLDERVFWVEARLVSGDVLRAQPVEGIFALASPTFNGFCAVRVLDGNETVIETQQIFEDTRCIPDPLWSIP
jgi:hypothetical protein